MHLSSPLHAQSRVKSPPRSHKKASGAAARHGLLPRGHRRVFLDTMRWWGCARRGPIRAFFQVPITLDLERFGGEVFMQASKEPRYGVFTSLYGHWRLPGVVLEAARTSHTWLTDPTRHRPLGTHFSTAPVQTPPSQIYNISDHFPNLSHVKLVLFISFSVCVCVCVSTRRLVKRNAQMHIKF